MGLLTSKIKCGNLAVLHYYLSPYLPLIAGRDSLSQSLLKFKQRIQPDLDTWISCAVEALGNLPFSTDTIIIRALRHDETTARTDFPSSLDLLGESLALRLHCRYHPNLLSKTRPTLPNKHLTRKERRSQLTGVYQTPSGQLPPETPFLLIDDILTTGATMRALIRTLRDAYPECLIKAFTLTRAGYHPPTPPVTRQ